MNIFCEACMHKEVCSFKSIFEEAVAAVRKVNISWPCSDGRIGMRDISAIDFITIRDPVCVHYIHDSRKENNNGTISIG